MRRLQHDGAVAELLDETILALDGLYMLGCVPKCWELGELTGIGNLGDLVALEAVPTLVTPSIHELKCGQVPALHGERGLMR